MSFLGGVEGSNGGVWPSEEPGFQGTSGEWVYDLVQLAKWFLCNFCSIPAPLQPYDLISELHSPF